MRIKLLLLSAWLLLATALPAFSATFPSQQNVPIDKEWRITFNRSIDATSLPGNIALTRTDIANIAAEPFPITPVLDSANPMAVIVKHSTPFVAGATYQLSINMGIKATTGKALTENVTMPFTVVKPTIGELKVHYIDVGQGDSIFIQTPLGKNILIDGGKTELTSTVENYLHSAGITSLDYVVATHADSDHIGSLDSVIKDFSIGKVYMPNVSNTTYSYEAFLSAMQAKGLLFNQAKAGETLDLGDNIEASFVGPVKDSYTDANNSSAVLHLKYGSTAFLFAGDAETASEGDMIASGVALKSTVLKIGHHGSTSSTSEAFLNAVQPKYVVISVGPNNYGHPAETVLNRLSAHGVSVFRTDVSGSIVATSNGTDITFNSTATTPTTPTASDSIKITAIDLSAEIATITNTGTTAMDLSGWKLVSEQGPQSFVFPSGTTVPAGGSLRIVSGPDGVAGIHTLLWTNSNIWLNSGDPGALYNSQGQLISRYPQ